MTTSRIADSSLALPGRTKSAGLAVHAVLSLLAKKYRDEKPLAGCRLVACLHLEAKTACLLRT